MALSYKTRMRWSLVILLIGLPLYIAAALFAVSLLDRPSVPVEFGIYAILGLAWMVPMRAVFVGVGKADPKSIGTEQDPADRI